LDKEAAENREGSTLVQNSTPNASCNQDQDRQIVAATKFQAIKLNELVIKPENFDGKKPEPRS